MDLADKLDRLIIKVDGALLALDELMVQEQSKLPHDIPDYSEGFRLLGGAFDYLEQGLDALCEAHGAYEEDKT